MTDERNIPFYIEGGDYYSVPLSNLTEFCRKNIERMNWMDFDYFIPLEPNFIREFQDEIIWSVLCARNKLTEEFIEEFEERVDWLEISYNQKLSESFMRKHREKLNFFYVAISQKLSESFILDFSEQLPLPQVGTYQDISLSLALKLNCDPFWILENNNNLSRENKKRYEKYTQFKKSFSLSHQKENT